MEGQLANDVVTLVESRYWPLDPLFGVFIRVTISTLWRLGVLSAAQGVFSLNGHPVNKAEVVGTIVRRDDKDGRFLFVVDDTTGLIEVLVWEKRFVREPQIDVADLQLGAMVRVRGRLAVYNDRPQLTAYAVEVFPADCEALVEEMRHWEDLRQVSSAYQEPVAEYAPHHQNERSLMLAIVDPSRTHEQSKLLICGRAQLLLSQCEGGVALETDLAYAVCPDRALLREGLRLLCDHGGAYWSGVGTSSLSVTQIRPEENLAHVVEKCVKSNPGCTVATLLQAVSQYEPQWRCVRSDQIDASLRYLEAESRVFDDGEGHWKCLE